MNGIEGIRSDLTDIIHDGTVGFGPDTERALGQLSALLDVAKMAERVTTCRAIYALTLDGLDAADKGERIGDWARAVAAAKGDLERCNDALVDALVAL